MATIGEISIIPIGGINFRKNPKYGSHTDAKNRPTAESCAAGIHDSRIYPIIINV